MKISNFFNFIVDYERKVYLILFAFFTVGFAYGCYFSLCGKTGDCLFATFLSGNHNLLINIMIKDVLFLSVTFILGYTVIGFPILCFNIILCGMYYGIAVSQYAFLYGIRGAFISGVTFFPYLFVLSTSLLLLTFSSLRMSAALFNVFKKGTRFISPRTYSVPHIIRFVFLSIVNVVFSFIFSYVYYPLVSDFL